MGFIRGLFGGQRPAPTDAGHMSDRDDHVDDDDEIGEDDEIDEDEASEGGQRRYLEFIGGTSAKFYAVVLHGDEDDGWSVAFNFGRIGTARDWAYKVEGEDLEEAEQVFDDLVAEKQRKGYETRAWPPNLPMPEDAHGQWADAEPQGVPSPGMFLSAVRGTLPATSGDRVGGISLPPGRLFTAAAEGGPRGPRPVLWISESPLERVSETWGSLASAFAETGLWPLIVDPEDRLESFSERLMDVPRGRPSDAARILQRWWRDSVGEEGEFDEGAYAPFGRRFPGLAPSTPGDRPASIDHLVEDFTGHLGLVAVERPGDVLDVIGWMGAANYDLDPADQSVVLRSWEDRFDAYLVGLGFETIIVVVARPPLDRPMATGIAAEHAAFCSDNITQGVGTVREYADELVRAHRWEFWWD
jgi:predicted DNA-binding WGR domain protein